MEEFLLHNRASIHGAVYFAALSVMAIWESRATAALPSESAREAVVRQLFPYVHQYRTQPMAGPDDRRGACKHRRRA